MSGRDRLGRWLTIAFGLGFVLLGLRFFADPHALTGESNVALPDAKAVMEIRTVYGGMFAGLGIALAWLGARAATLGAALWLLLVVMSVVAAARIVAILLGQAPDALFATLLVVELVGAALAAVALRAPTRS